MLPIGSRSALGRSAACVLAMVGLTGLEPCAHAADAPQETPNGASTEPGSDSRPTARIVLIGEVGADPELAPLLSELLDRQQTDAVIERAPRFDADALFAEQDRDSLGIFIALRSANEARLYFRAPGGERYLVRKLALPSGLDAVGRELVGQVVALSTESLSASATGLSREQASAEIASESTPDAEHAPPPAAASSAATSQPQASGKKTTTVESRRALGELRALARYSATWTGPDLGLRHGPGLDLGARFGRGVFLGLELGGSYFFTQTFEDPALDGQLQAAQLQALLETGTRLSPESAVTLAVGPRLERSEFRAQARSAAVTVVDPDERLLGGLRLEGGYEWSSSHLVLGIVVLADVAFVRTHYDLAQPDGTTETIASLWPFRPGAALTIGIH